MKGHDHPLEGGCWPVAEELLLDQLKDFLWEDEVNLDEVLGTVYTRSTISESHIPCVQNPELPTTPMASTWLALVWGPDAALRPMSHSIWTPGTAPVG
jgi:hypothetical protein